MINVTFTIYNGGKTIRIITRIDREIKTQSILFPTSFILLPFWYSFIPPAVTIFK
jgi:hypothetical protein